MMGAVRMMQMMGAVRSMRVMLQRHLLDAVCRLQDMGSVPVSPTVKATTSVENSITTVHRALPNLLPHDFFPYA